MNQNEQDFAVKTTLSCKTSSTCIDVSYFGEASEVLNAEKISLPDLFVIKSLRYCPRPRW